MYSPTLTQKLTAKHYVHVCRILKDFDLLGFDFLQQAYNALFSDELGIWDFSGINLIDAITIINAHEILAPDFDHTLNKVFGF